MTSTTQVRYITDLDERSRILASCHNDPTSGHLGTKKTLGRVSERFMWQGMVNDVNKLVSK